jgi:hypothetical protein
MEPFLKLISSLALRKIVIIAIQFGAQCDENMGMISNYDVYKHFTPFVSPEGWKCISSLQQVIEGVSAT